MTANVSTPLGTLTTLSRGAGPVVLMAHGFPLDHRMWNGAVDTLAAAGFRAIAPDLPGFGQSEVCASLTTMEQMADACHDLLSTMGVRANEKIVFCGLSMGGYVAWQFWRKYADRLRALVLCDTRAVADSPEAARGRTELAERIRREGSSAAGAMIDKLLAESTRRDRPEVVGAVRAMIESQPPAGLAAALAGMAARPAATDWLPRIELPALVVVGEHDAIATVDEMRSIADALPQSTFEVVPGAGHMPPLESPDVFHAALLRFLRALPSNV